jgi:hypothetical protein
MTDTVRFEGTYWDIVGVRTAEQVLAEFPDPRMGEIMQQKELELLLLKRVDTVDLMFMRAYGMLQTTVAFRDNKGNLTSPDIAFQDQQIDAPS